jgi:hypothetical protein
MTNQIYKCIVSGKIIPQERVEALKSLGIPESRYTCVEHALNVPRKGIYLGEVGTSELLIVDKVYNDSVRSVFKGSKKQADMSIAQMKINIANGQRAEKLGLAKDAIGSYQAAETLRLNAVKAAQDQDAKTLKALAYADKATQPPKPVAAPKESDMVIFSKASPTEQAEMIKYFKGKGDTAMATALAAIAGRADVAGGQQGIEAIGKMAQLRKQAAAEIDNEEFTNRETRARYKANPAERQKDIDARVESLVESAQKISPGKAKPVIKLD